MVRLWYFVISVIISSISSEPIIRGLNVGKEVKGKIVNGEEFPSLVFVEITYNDPEDREEYSGNCGGILIKPKAVITSAHCLNICGEITSIMVWAGVSHLEVQKNLGQKRYAKYYRVHENYGGEDPLSRTYMHNDIGVIWLHKNFDLNNAVKLAKLPQSSIISTGESGWAAGWGQTESEDVSSVLKKVMLKVISQPACRHYYTANHFNGKNFCAEPFKKGSNVAFGDSGGPLVIKGVVAGMLSHGCIFINKLPDGTEVRECDIFKPTIFVDIFKYKDWILSNINDINKKILAGAIKKIVKNIGKVCRRNPLKIFKRRQQSSEASQLQPPIPI